MGKALLLLGFLLLIAACSGIKNEKVTPQNVQGLVEKAMKGDELTESEKKALEAGVNKLIMPTIQIDSRSGYTVVQIDSDLREKNLRGKDINDLILIGQEELRRRGEKNTH